MQKLPIAGIFVLIFAIVTSGQLPNDNLNSRYRTDQPSRPNILFAISDDQSWLHTGAYGDPLVKTPVFDAVAANGALFNHAYTSAPSCTPSRATILTGQHHWRLGKGANLHSTLSTEYTCYTELLEEAGYHVGFSGKGWDPGDYTDGGRTQNPAGEAYNQKTYKPDQLPASGFRPINYAANFELFMAGKQEDTPFCFWYGGREPHRPYEDGSGKRHGKDPKSVLVPGHLPDHPDVRSDILDYYLEIEWFDQHLGRMIRLLEELGELKNTLIVVTSDNGMPFPRSKTNLYDTGVRLPLVIQWLDRFPGGKMFDEMIHFTDFAPTILEAAGLEIPSDMTGTSLLPLLESISGKDIEWRDHVVFGRERHTVYANEGRAYGARGIRTHDFLLIQNPNTELWPAGQPPHFTDIDRGPSKYMFLSQQDHQAVVPFLEQTLSRRPEIELYDSRNDPDQRINLAQDPNYKKIRQSLEKTLNTELLRLRDPRTLGQKVSWDRDPYHGGSYENWIETQGQQFEAYKKSRKL
jgi:N-sulfoglucosamine sulfohydrolase